MKGVDSKLRHALGPPSSTTNSHSSPASSFPRQNSAAVEVAAAPSLPQTLSQHSTSPILHHSIPHDSTAFPRQNDLSPQPAAQESDGGGSVAAAQVPAAPSLHHSNPDNWELLFNQTVLYAAVHVGRWHWRGSIGGVLPDGYDPNSITAEAIAEFLRNSAEPGNRSRPLPDRIQIRRELERLVRKQVNRLHHRIENQLLRNEPDLAPVTLDDGEIVSIPDPDPNPAETAIHKEDDARFEAFKQAFDAYLGNQRRLRGVFRCFCNGISRPKALASRLKLGVHVIQQIQRRLQRRMLEFLRSRDTRT